MLASLKTLIKNILGKFSPVNKKTLYENVELNCEFCGKVDLNKEWQNDRGDRAICDNCKTENLCQECAKSCQECYNTCCPDCLEFCEKCREFICKQCFEKHLDDCCKLSEAYDEFVKQVTTSNLSKYVKEIIIETVQKQDLLKLLEKE